MEHKKKPDQLSFLSELTEKKEQKIKAEIKTQFEQFAEFEEFKQLMTHAMAYTQANDLLENETKDLDKQLVASIVITLVLFWSLAFTNSEVLSESLALEINVALFVPSLIYLIRKFLEFYNTEKNRSLLHKVRASLVETLNVDFHFINIFIRLNFDGDEMLKQLSILQRSKMERERVLQEARQMRLMNENKPLRLTDEGEFESDEVSTPRKKKSN